jgi:hypothetical protein
MEWSTPTPEELLKVCLSAKEEYGTLIALKSIPEHERRAIEAKASDTQRRNQAALDSIRRSAGAFCVDDALLLC